MKKFLKKNYILIIVSVFSSTMYTSFAAEPMDTEPFEEKSGNSTDILEQRNIEPLSIQTTLVEGGGSPFLYLSNLKTSPISIDATKGFQFVNDAKQTDLTSILYRLREVSLINVHSTQSTPGAVWSKEKIEFSESFVLNLSLHMERMQNVAADFNCGQAIMFQDVGTDVIGDGDLGLSGINLSENAYNIHYTKSSQAAKPIVTILENNISKATFNMSLPVGPNGGTNAKVNITASWDAIKKEMTWDFIANESNIIENNNYMFKKYTIVDPIDLQAKFPNGCYYGLIGGARNKTKASLTGHMFNTLSEDGVIQGFSKPSKEEIEIDEPVEIDYRIVNQSGQKATDIKAVLTIPPSLEFVGIESEDILSSIYDETTRQLTIETEDLVPQSFWSNETDRSEFKLKLKGAKKANPAIVSGMMTFNAYGTQKNSVVEEASIIVNGPDIPDPIDPVAYLVFPKKVSLSLNEKENLVEGEETISYILPEGVIEDEAFELSVAPHLELCSSTDKGAVLIYHDTGEPVIVDTPLCLLSPNTPSYQFGLKGNAGEFATLGNYKGNLEFFIRQIEN